MEGTKYVVIQGQTKQHMLFSSPLFGCYFCLKVTDILYHFDGFLLSGDVETNPGPMTIPCPRMLFFLKTKGHILQIRP